MSPILQSVIHTVAFYDAVGSVPLTNVELYKYLLYTNGLPAVSLAGFLRVLDEECATLRLYICSYRGFYFLKKNRGAYARRVAIGKTSIAKWRIAQKMIGLISLVPYVRMVAVTGSLALNATRKESDIDVLIVVKHGHIWTTRVFVSFLMHILGKRRHGQRIRDRICLNHYMADSHLVLRPLSLFSAHIYSSLVPCWSMAGIDTAFLQENAGWTRQYLARLREGKTYRRGITPRIGNLRIFRFAFERLVPVSGARILESFLKKIQVQKIGHNTSRPEGGGESILGDTALVFHHPRPQNQEALYLYKQNLQELGLA